MAWLPLSLDVTGKPCLVVGGGEVALRKARLLARAGAVLRVVAPTIHDELLALAQASGGQCWHQPFDDEHLAGVVLVVIATDDPELSTYVSAVAQLENILVNAVDQPALCTVIFPSTVTRGELSVAVSSGGAAPVLTRLLRARLESLLPAALADLAQEAGAFRPVAKAALPEPATRQRFWQQVLEQVLHAQEPPRLDAAGLARQLQAFQAGASAAGSVTTIPALADPADMTLRQLRALQGCDTLLLAGEVPPAVQDMARRDARRVMADNAGTAQAQADSLAQQGEHVVILHGMGL